jgi:hypothetical protein
VSFRRAGGEVVMDPRHTPRASKRDLEAGAWIGKGYEVAQYQLHEAVFSGKSPVVVSRFTTRWQERGFILVERWNRIGMNRLRLTSKGRDFLLLNAAAAPEDLFVPARSVAAKDLAHRLWINDLRVVLAKLPAKPELVLPAWALERRFTPRLPAIPDVLAVTRRGDSRVALAVEVDLGGEPLKSVFVPKLSVLQGVLREMSRDGSSAVLVLTSSDRRRDAIAEATSNLDAGIPIAVETLPKECGRNGLQALLRMFTPAVHATSQPTEDKAQCLS